MSTSTVGPGAAAEPAGDTLPAYAGRIEQAELQVRNLIATYEVIAEWIRFADTKAALVLTINGLFASFVISSIGELAAVSPSPSGIVAYRVFGAGLVRRLVMLGSVPLCPAAETERGAPGGGVQPALPSSCNRGTLSDRRA